MMVKKLFENRVTEKDIRSWLDKNGFFGKGAELHELELHALKRPGWLQVFRFHMSAKRRDLNQSTDADGLEDSGDRGLPRQSNQWNELYGVVRDDERIKDRTLRTQICVFKSKLDRQSKLDELSNGLLTCQTGQTGSLVGLVVIVGVVILIGSAAAALF